MSRAYKRARPDENVTPDLEAPSHVKREPGMDEQFMDEQFNEPHEDMRGNRRTSSSPDVVDHALQKALRELPELSRVSLQTDGPQRLQAAYERSIELLTYLAEESVEREAHVKKCEEQNNDLKTDRKEILRFNRCYKGNLASMINMLDKWKSEKKWDTEIDENEDEDIERGQRQVATPENLDIPPRDLQQEMTRIDQQEMTRIDRERELAVALAESRADIIKLKDAEITRLTAELAVWRED